MVSKWREQKNQIPFRLNTAKFLLPPPKQFFVKQIDSFLPTKNSVLKFTWGKGLCLY